MFVIFHIDLFEILFAIGGVVQVKYLFMVLKERLLSICLFFVATC